MLRLAFKTPKSRDEILTEAERFFKEHGLAVAERGDSYLLLKGGGGYVRVEALHRPETEVTLETREWEYQVKQFAEREGRNKNSNNSHWSRPRLS